MDVRHIGRAVLRQAQPWRVSGGRGIGRRVRWSAGQRLLRRIQPLLGAEAAVLGAPFAGHPWPEGRTPAISDWRGGRPRSTTCTEAGDLSDADARERNAARRRLERKLLALCRPYSDDESAVQRRLCRRIERFIKELFVFVAEPGVPSDDNAAERSLRHLVVSRKIGGGTRSARGTDTRMALASLFGTWHAQRVNPLIACR